MGQLNRILDSIEHSDTLGHMFTVDTKFHDINFMTLTRKHCYLMKYTLIYLRKKIDPFERSTLQIMNIIARSEEKEKIKSFSYNSKTHSTLKDKRFVTLYAEDLHFLVTRAGWLVTYIYVHYTFEQAKFKKEFVIMNQKSRESVSSKVEKDFYKLLNNSNFGIDCQKKHWKLLLRTS